MATPRSSSLPTARTAARRRRKRVRPLAGAHGRAERRMLRPRACHLACVEPCRGHRLVSAGRRRLGAWPARRAGAPRSSVNTAVQQCVISGAWRSSLCGTYASGGRRGRAPRRRAAGHGRQAVALPSGARGHADRLLRRLRLPEEQPAEPGRRAGLPPDNIRAGARPRRPCPRAAAARLPLSSSGSCASATRWDTHVPVVSLGRRPRRRGRPSPRPSCAPSPTLRPVRPALVQPRQGTPPGRATAAAATLRVDTVRVRRAHWGAACSSRRGTLARGRGGRARPVQTRAPG